VGAFLTSFFTVTPFVTHQLTESEWSREPFPSSQRTAA
jgi:hypothetical protein